MNQGFFFFFWTTMVGWPGHHLYPSSFGMSFYMKSLPGQANGQANITVD